MVSYLCNISKGIERNYHGHVGKKANCYRAMEIRSKDLIRAIGSVLLMG